MQFTITREKLLKPLQQVCSVLNSRPTLPIINNILLEVKGNLLFLTGTDLEVELTTQAELEEHLQTEAKLTIPAKKFLDICKSLPEDSLISVKFEEDRVLIQASRSKFNLATLPASDYPSLMDWSSDVDFNIEQATLTRLIDATQFSMANQDARYFLNGMKFETEGNLLRAIATDGHRLAVCTMPLAQELPSHSVIVPRKAVIELSRLLIPNDETTRLEIGANHIRFSMNKIVFTSKLIDGRFPDYRRVLPRNADRILEADTETLKRALVRAAILSNERFRGVRLLLTNNLLKITANNPEQEEAEEIIDVAYQNVEMEVGFNVSYLLDVLNTLKCERVRINLVDSSSSCLIENCDNNSAEYVIMPMRL
ncbi:DNA polymerase III subunit beta [Pasteurella atlantica]|uniref:DNA polymerase III subunit beta n=2 Tax=Pasteurellaceae TaxID=712 RepID=A0ACC6HLG7_9PAST|nr:DNA polymerase III subunit beta [Pasteurella atlantica]MDP8051643.1 DNA polymerase III subunit beta [Pasteurella atlantica]MDP8098600.1 DNA polymerase III subunit beta [Pasteurella atlantica]MDP8100928.1 DNA polymerase III subunit beta [Pasteurella atlantica]MDP8105034.1 DNA polymerase III subunit beta [Pasteurella atlantica]MDP8106708.1 DNA polymerase III subunit beta [Pasteurella atlantica]